MKFLFSVIFLFAQGVSFAESSKITNVDLDIKTTEIVDISLGHYTRYIIDKTACVCLMWHNQGAASVECGKLAAYPQLKDHLRNCK